MGWKTVETLIVLLVAAVALAVFTWSALGFEELESVKGGKGYVSDEVWYVGSARTILVKVFGLEPRMPGDSYGYTVVYSGQVDYGVLESLAARYGLRLRVDYSDLKAFYVSGSREGLTGFLSEARRYVEVGDVIPGWMMPDHSGINNYLNQEHPPLGKYIIAFTMYVLGDRPFYWRIPLIVLGASTTILLYLSLRRLTGSTIAALAASLLFTADPLVRTLFSIALLDGFVAFTSTLAFYLAVERRHGLAVAASLVGGLFKFTGLFTLIPLLVLYLRQGLRRRPSPYMLVYTLTAFTLLSGLLFLTVLAAVSLPLINYMGLGNWVKYSLLGSITWHTSIKCNGPCPGSSAPWDWFLGVNAFTVYVDPTVAAIGFYPLWSTVLVASIVLAPLVFRDKRYGLQWVFLTGVLAGYVAVWLAGGRSQYSFYSVQLAPFVYGGLVYTAAYALRRENLAYLAGFYRRVSALTVWLLTR
ncbi:glycosyltransferase family 39 protein [Desulfurococcus mucosus]|uniref:Glycosyl transferase family 39 n=1 Tax=Desulfurococcus mucosus (strain ATCC 35584 / DSM 2162 / JCM 9187 / O7/1) TaxID=765177 RepID=E8R7D1_DESM0|nr:glycosyltransferase family 39 protein [Desulfurococcus mucosus]ADV65596.1 glycosyl transferase family 39 [Desulfurococcus mucosus DSM 2162]